MLDVDFDMKFVAEITAAMPIMNNIVSKIMLLPLHMNGVKVIKSLRLNF